MDTAPSQTGVNRSGKHRICRQGSGTLVLVGPYPIPAGLSCPPARSLKIHDNGRGLHCQKGALALLFGTCASETYI